MGIMSPVESKMMAILHTATNELRWRILNAISKGPKTCSDLAEECDIMPQHALWHATELVRVGLVRVQYTHSKEKDIKVKTFVVVPTEFTISFSKRGGAKIKAKSLDV